jgi:hypothetical protein
MNRDLMTPAWMENVPDINNPNPTYIKSGMTKAAIDLQISRVERNLREVRRNCENCSSLTLKPSYYQMIRKYEEMLENLRTERLHAR